MRTSMSYACALSSAIIEQEAGLLRDTGDGSTSSGMIPPERGSGLDAEMAEDELGRLTR